MYIYYNLYYYYCKITWTESFNSPSTYLPSESDTHNDNKMKLDKEIIVLV